MHIFGELEITAADAVPFRARDIIKITCLQQPGLRFQMAVLRDAVFQLGSEAAPKILLNCDRGLLGIIHSGDQILMAGFDTGEIVSDFR